MKKYQAGFSVVEIIIALAVVGVIGGVGYMVMSRSDDTASPSTNNATPAKPTSSGDSGSCFGVSKETIKTLLGAPAANLQDLSDTGTQDVGQGDKARTCVYAFAKDADSTNSFSMDLGTYASQANLTDSKKYLPSEGGAVEGLGDSASYTATDATLTSTRDFVLTVQQDLKVYKFSISQPLDSLGYNDASAQRVLIQIAQAATL